MFSTRAQAQAAVGQGRVLVSGSVADKAARMVAPDEPVRVIESGDRYVGRGGHKLAGALDELEIPVAGRHALDVGASTGGFTDCLLRRGAASVTAVDVGRDQFAAELRGDSRITLREQTDIRKFAAEAATVGTAFELVVCDVSFISLTTVAGHLMDLCRPGADLVVLVKPQFEVGRRDASRGRGVISDPLLWESSVDRVAEALTGHGARVGRRVRSRVTGAKGNVEFFLHAVAVGGGPWP